jgi:hypothetical protein
MASSLSTIYSSFFVDRCTVTVSIFDPKYASTFTAQDEQIPCSDAIDRLSSLRSQMESRSGQQERYKIKFHVRQRSYECDCDSLAIARECYEKATGTYSGLD